LLGLGLAVASSTARVSAHHSFAMFEVEKNVDYMGVVTD
jgi:hypothetical protein